MMRRTAWMLLVVMTACAEPGFIPQFPIPTPAAGACSAVLSPPELEVSHISPPEKGRYNTNPPSSGIHYGEWADAGVHDEPIADENQVHNLEHGHVIVQYRQLTAAQVAALRAELEADPTMMVMAPRPAMPWTVTLTSWGKIQVCSGFPDDMRAIIRRFVAANRDHAPESIP